MNAVIDQIDLSVYSVEELKALIARAKRAIALKQRRRLQQVREQIEQLASGLNMSIEEVMNRGRQVGKVYSNTAAEIKFRNPADPAQTWTGRGKRPRWLQEALRQGAKLEDFAIAR
jgi:DNA-binding protein H-NS